MREQKQKLVEARVQRELLRNGGTELGPTSLPSSTLPGAPYDQAAGLCVFFDFVTALPWQATKCLLVYAIYDGARPADGIKSLPAAECEPEPGGFTRALLATRRQFMHLVPSTDLKLLVEIQQVLAPSAETNGEPTTVPVGWCSMPLFTPTAALKAGFWRLALFKPPISIVDEAHQRVPVPKVTLFLRLTLTADMERNRNFAGARAAAAPSPVRPADRRALRRVPHQRGLPSPPKRRSLCSNPVARSRPRAHRLHLRVAVRGGAASGRRRRRRWRPAGFGAAQGGRARIHPQSVLFGRHAAARAPRAGGELQRPARAQRHRRRDPRTRERFCVHPRRRRREWRRGRRGVGA